MSEIGSGDGTSYPGAIDTDITQEVNAPSANKTRARMEVVNDLADAIIAIEGELGINPRGTAVTVKDFLQVQHNTDGSHKTITTNTLTATGQITSSLAIGTKPLVITSTTKCDNLNADYLRGYVINQDLETTDSPTFVNVTAALTGNATTATTATNAAGTGTAVYSTETGLRIVRGEIRTVDSAILSGSGFSVVMNSTGNWTLTITAAFSGRFTIIVGNGATAGSSWAGTYTAKWVNVSSAQILGNYDSAAGDADSFHFICIGPK